MTPAAQAMNNRAPIFLCADPDEAERLALRDVNAICPPPGAALAELRQYEGAAFYVTPRAERDRFDVACWLASLGCTVRALDSTFTVEVADPITHPSKPMFPAVPVAGTDAASEHDGVKIGGALALAMAMDEVEFIARPILVRGQLGTITGHPSHGKTTLFNGLCVAMALERSFGPIEPEAAGLVYVVSAEDFQGTRNRILAEAARLRLDADERARLDARLRWAHVETSATAATIKAAIESDADGRDVALIFVDTGPALFCGDDENDNIALRNFVEGFASWRHLPGKPATVLAWHPSKGATADRLEPRGASAIKATCDFNLTIWRDDDTVTLGHTKVRAQHFDPIEGRLSAVDLITASGALYSAPVITLNSDERAERSDAREAREAILRGMYVNRPNPPTVRELAAAIGFSTSKTFRHLQHLASVHPALVAKDAVDDRYTLTTKGESRAKALADQSRNAYANARDPG